MKNKPTPDELRAAIACDKEILFAGGHHGNSRLYAKLSVTPESWSICWWTDVNGVKTQYDGLASAVRGYCNAL